MTVQLEMMLARLEAVEQELRHRCDVAAIRDVLVRYSCALDWLDDVSSAIHTKLTEVAIARSGAVASKQ